MKKKNLINLLFLLFLIVGTVVILRNSAAAANLQRKSEGAVFGTYYHVTYEAPALLDEKIREELDKVDASLSMFNERSTLSLVNRNEAAAPDSLFRKVFSLAARISRETDGAFDATVAPLVNAWGFGFKHAENLAPGQVDSLLAFVGFSKVALKGNRVVKEDPRVTLDFGAIAKGFGVDVVARMLDREGVENYMVEIGGEVVTKGKNAEGKNWRIGVSKPVEAEAEVDGGEGLQVVFGLTDVALATSGNYRNFYYKDGKKYAHTIDPATGYPVQHNLLSASVFASTCAEADAYATAFMVMGLEKAKRFLASRPALMAYLIYADGEGRLCTWASPELEKYVVR